MTSERTKHLAVLSQSLFLPCLIFTDMLYCEQCKAPGKQPAATCNGCPSIADMIKVSWYLFLWPLVVVSTGIVLGKLVAMWFHGTDEVKRLCMATIAFGNSTGLPTVILLVFARPLMAEGVLRTDPLLYLPIYLILYPILQYTLGQHLLKKVSEEEALPGALPAELEAQEEGSGSDSFDSIDFPEASKGAHSESGVSQRVDGAGVYRCLPFCPGFPSAFFSQVPAKGKRAIESAAIEAKSESGESEMDTKVSLDCSWVENKWLQLAHKAFQFCRKVSSPPLVLL